MRKNFIVALLVVALVGGLWMASSARKPRKPLPTSEEIWADGGVPVEVTTLGRGDMSTSVEITGDINALKDATLSSKIAGRVTAVYAREGEQVSAGQVLIVLDQDDAQANLQSAQGALASAAARLSQARTNAKVTKIQTDSAIEQAQSALTAATSRLAVVRQPARSQERMVAENRVAAAKANLENAEANFKRHQMLLNEGAIADSAFDVAKAQYAVAQADHKSAIEQLSLVDEGGRSEDIRAAQSQVDMAREQLRSAKANASQNLLRQEDIKSAQAAVWQAQSAVSLARQQLNNTYIRSPLTGRMASRSVEPGQVVSPGEALGRIVNLGSVYFKGDIPEADLAAVAISQPVEVRIDAISSKVFRGRVTEIYPAGSAASRNFPVRITIDSASGIKPGMFARGKIITGVARDALLVPKDAIDSRKGTQSVFAVQPGKTVKRHIVSVVQEGRDVVQIEMSSGLEEGQTVVTKGRQNLQDGSKIEVSQGEAGR